MTGAALFLFGMTLMGEGLKQIAGSRLEVILYKLTGRPMKGLLFGAGITMVIQSSSATSVMVVGFVNSGMMRVGQAILIVLGAIFGTSVTGWIICLSSIDAGPGWLALFSTETLTCVVALAGVFLRVFSKNRFKNHLGDVLLGFAMLMFGMSAMSGTVSPLSESAAFQNALTEFSNPLRGILVGLAFTSVLQSASAAVGILQALSMTGGIRFDMALPLLMGIAIGAAIPVLLSAVGSTAEGKRTALAYLISNVLGAAFSGVVFYGLNAFLRFPFMQDTMTMTTIAALNSVYRLAIVTVLFPMRRQIEAIVHRLVRASKNSADDAITLMPLEERFAEHPALAVEQCRIAMGDMAGKAKEALFLAFGLLTNYRQGDDARVQALEETVDRYEDKLGTYLLRVTGKELTEAQNESTGKYLHTMTDFERVSDHAVNIASAARELHEKGLSFSPVALREIQTVQAAVSEIVTMATDAFICNDLQLAAKVEPLDELIGNLCGELKLHHVERLKGGICSLGSGFVFGDLLTDYERVADHCSNIAVALIALESDSFDTHEYLDSVKRLKNDAYATCFEEYSREFTIDE